MQTPRQVIDGLLRGTSFDRVGLHDSPWGDTVKKWVTQGMPTDDKGNAVDAAEHFGFDLRGAGGWFNWQPFPGTDEIIEETDEWKIVKNGAGAHLKWWKNKSGTPEHVDFTMTSREVWDRDYRPAVVKDPAARISDDAIKGCTEAIKKLHTGGDWWAFCGNQFIWENMRASLGDMTMYMSLVQDKAWIHDVCRCYTDMYKTCWGKLFDRAGVPDGVWIYEDLGYRDRLFASPETFKEMIFPYFAELVEFCHGYDLPVVLHTCGFTEPALDMIVDAGFDGLHPMEVKAGNDALRIADGYKDKLCFIGGLDERILESGDRDLIRAKVTEIVEGMKARGARYVYASDHSISTNVDYEDFQFAIDVYREHMYY